MGKVLFPRGPRKRAPHGSRRTSKKAKKPFSEFLKEAIKGLEGRR